MEFWGVEVKSGQPLSVSPGENKVLHLSQACLGEVKKDKGNESVCLFVNIDGKKLVLGTLIHEKLPQQLFDLVFDRDFELTHNWKNGSVYFYGYKADNPFDEEPEDDGFELDSEDEDDISLHAVNNGKQEVQVKQEKPAAAQKANAIKDSASGKQKVRIVEPSKDSKPEGDDDDSDESDDSMSDDDSESGEDVDSLSDDDEENEDSDEDEETPKKVESGKKRPMESSTKTPGPEKKAKLITPQKSDGKKGGHVATPHPSKQVGKTPANKSDQKTPKSEGSHSCKACNRDFKSENALQSHNQAKHSAGK